MIAVDEAVRSFFNPAQPASTHGPAFSDVGSSFSIFGPEVSGYPRQVVIAAISNDCL